MNAFTQKPDTSAFIKQARINAVKSQVARGGIKNMTEEQRKVLYSPVVKKEKK